MKLWKQICALCPLKGKEGVVLLYHLPLFAGEGAPDVLAKLAEVPEIHTTVGSRYGCDGSSKIFV